MVGPWRTHSVGLAISVTIGIGVTSLTSTGTGGAAQSDVRLKSIGSFDRPVHITAPNGDRKRVYIVEQPGTIRVVKRGRSRVFLNIRRRTSNGNEQGLLSMAFAPDYSRTKRFYVNYTDNRGDTKIVEYRAKSPTKARKGSARKVLTVDQPYENHNGGQLQFGPDGLLYVGMGDGGGGGDADNNAQDPRSLLGKMLRIDPVSSNGRPYTIPATNPYVGRSGTRSEIYATGFRNPWRFSFDRTTGDLIVGDVGQSAWEEINYSARDSARGANFGWRVFEGSHRFSSGAVPNAVRPVIEKSHDDGWCSVVGGYVVRDPRLPAMAGQYLYGDFCRGGIRAAVLGPGGASGDRSVGLHVANLSSFGEDGRGRVYAASLRGKVFRLVAGR